MISIIMNSNSNSSSSSSSNNTGYYYHHYYHHYYSLAHLRLRRGVMLEQNIDLRAALLGGTCWRKTHPLS